LLEDEVEASVGPWEPRANVAAHLSPPTINMQATFPGDLLGDNPSPLLEAAQSTDPDVVFRASSLRSELVLEFAKLLQPCWAEAGGDAPVLEIEVRVHSLGDRAMVMDAEVLRIVRGMPTPAILACARASLAGTREIKPAIATQPFTEDFDGRDRVLVYVPTGQCGNP
jgi:hypothetical protein